MVWNMVTVYIGTLVALIVAFYSFLRGFRALERLEEGKWREHFKESIEAIDRTLPTTEPISQ